MEQDEVVEELDVYYCSKDELGAQLYILQHVLRPEWNPYNTEVAEMIQFKPQSRKLEIEIPINHHREDSEEEMNETERADTLKLSSTEVDLKSTFYAIGFKRSRAVYLTGIEGVLQLKPDLGCLDQEDDKIEDKPKEELTKIQAKIPRRETAAEQQRRENSWVYIAKKERMEKWKPLQSIRSSSRLTDKVIDQLTTSIDKDVDVSMSKSEFLSNIAPEILRKQSIVRKQPIEDSSHPKRVELTVQSSLSITYGLFALDGVVNLKDIRHWLRQFKDDGSELYALAVVEDELLHNAILRSSNVTCIRRVYMRLATGSAQLDPLRTILMEVVQQKETIKRNDVISAAKAKGVRITEKLFDTIMREICVAKDGGFWTLKTGRVNR